MEMLAEISDKMTPLWLMLVIGTIPAAAAIGLRRIHWLLALLPVPLLALLTYACIAELFEPDFGNIITSEMGWSYAIGRVVMLDAPFILLLSRWAMKRSKTTRSTIPRETNNPELG